MAWINIASTRFLTKAKLIRSLQNWEQEDELIGTHNLGLSALLYGHKDVFEQTKRFTDKWLTYYAKKEDKTLAQANVFPVFANLCILDFLHGKQTSEHLSRVIDLRLPKQKSLQSLQKIIAKAVEDDVFDATDRQPILGHIDTTDEWLALLDTGNIHSLFDLAICPDHPLWSETLADFCLPLALLLHKIEQKETTTTAIEAYMRLGATPARHQHVLYERQSPRPRLEAEVTDDTNTWPGFDAIEQRDDKLLVYHWLGFDWKADLDFSPTEALHAFRPLQFTDLGWKLVEKQTESRQWAAIEQYRNTGHIIHVLVYNQTWSEADKKQTQKAMNTLNMDIQLLDFTAI